MERINVPILTSVDRLDDGIVIKFADESCFFFSTSLLHTVAPLATTLNENLLAW